MSQNSLLLLQNRILIVQQPQLIDRQRQSRQTCDGSGKKQTPINKTRMKKTKTLSHEGCHSIPKNDAATSVARAAEP